MGKRTVDDLLPNEKVQIQFYTDVKLKGGKSNPLQGKVRKLTTVFATTTGENVYADRVSKQLFSEGKGVNYEPKPRPWGERVGDTPIIEHTNKAGEYKRYLEFIVEGVISSNVLVDGVITDPDDIEGYPEKSEKNPDAQGGVDKEIVLRCVEDSKIISIVDIVKRKTQKIEATVSFKVETEFADNGTDLDQQMRNAVMKKLQGYEIDRSAIQTVRGAPA